MFIFKMINYKSTGREREKRDGVRGRVHERERDRERERERVREREREREREKIGFDCMN